MNKKIKMLLAMSLIATTIFCQTAIIASAREGKTRNNSIVTNGSVNAFTDITYLSDLNWESIKTTYPQLPTQKNKSVYSQPITINGVKYDKGLGTHACSEIVYNLGMNYTNFETLIGVDSEVGNHGSVVFQVFADDMKIYDSGVVTGVQPSQNVRLNVTGVRKLKLVVNDSGDGIDNDHADWANARVYNTSTYLSDINWKSQSTSFQPLPTQKDKSVYLQPITIKDKTYTKGIGTHAISEIVYELGGNFVLFRSDIGVDREVGDYGSVVFQVFGDGIKIYDSGVMTGANQAKSLNVDVRGVKQLKLVVTDAGDGINNDHADWANARIIN